jgi:tetratricopeptide (TPR) repeat protein
MRPDREYAKDDPLAQVVEFLEKADRDQLASDVIDVFAKYSNNIEQINLIAKLYLDVRNIEKAEDYAQRVLLLAPNPESKYNARANLGKMYNNINEPTKSLFYSRINAAVTPDDPDTKLEMVFSLYLLGRNTEAEAILRDMKTNEHTLSERHRDIVNFNLGTYDMQAGHFLKGLGGFLINVKKLELWFSPKELPYTYWNGGVYPGRTLILFMEGGGIGDEFITIRWMQDLKNLGFNPVYYTTRKDIYDIFTRCGYDCVMNLDNVPKNALWTYAMQVPLWLQVKPEQVRRENYLHPSQAARDKWAWVKDSKKIRIGVRWQGNAKNERDLHRRVPLDKIMPALKSALQGREVEYYSLQIGDGSEETAKYPELIDVSDQIESYDDTFALLENLDFVVSSCTSVLHAAAIMGTRTLGLIPISAYFTWLSPPTQGRPGNTSIWYGDNLRFFRQTEPKDWAKPLAELTDCLIEQIDDK